MLYRHFQQFAGARQTGKGGMVVLDPQEHPPAHEAQGSVAGQRAGQQAGLAEDLKTVADAEHQPAGLGELDDTLHDRGESGHGPGSKVVAVGEAAGQDHAVAAAGERVLVPQGADILFEHAAQTVDDVVVVAGAGKDCHPPTHV